MQDLTNEQQVLINHINNRDYKFFCVEDISLNDLDKIASFIKEFIFGTFTNSNGENYWVEPTLNLFTHDQQCLLLKKGIIKDCKYISDDSNNLLYNAISENDKELIKLILDSTNFKYYKMPHGFSYGRSPSQHNHPVYKFFNQGKENLDILFFTYHNLPTEDDKLSFLSDIGYYCSENKTNEPMKLCSSLFHSYYSMVKYAGHK